MHNFYFYSIHGLNVKSSIIFPELISGKHDSDIIIHCDDFDKFDHLRKFNGNPGFDKIIYNSQDILFLLDNKPLFRVKSGKEIIINSKLDIENSYLRYLILGPGMGTLLMQRGNLVLHASSVNVRGEAVVFLGESGIGKSTIATAMNKRGYPFITDDILALEFDEDNIAVFTSFPRAKLWNDTIMYMKDDSSLFQKIHPDVEKYSYIVTDNFFTNSLPLKMVYILDNGIKNEIYSLKPQNALIELVKNSYAINLFYDNEKVQNLFQCANIVKNVPIKCLNVKKKFNELENTILMIETDVFS
jgi:hypothetical protein